MADVPEIPLKRIRLELGVSREGVARRTKSVSSGTVKNAEDGRRVTNDTATQLRDAINELLAEQEKPTIILEDLGLQLY